MWSCVVLWVGLEVCRDLFLFGGWELGIEGGKGLEYGVFESLRLVLVGFGFFWGRKKFYLVFKEDNSFYFFVFYLRREGW